MPSRYPSSREDVRRAGDGQSLPIGAACRDQAATPMERKATRMKSEAAVAI